MLDAPVTGSAPRAEAGTLTIMAGGETEDFAGVRPLLGAMGEVIVHVGALGQGEMPKLINNSIGAANAAALAEGLLLRERLRPRPRRLRTGPLQRLRRLRPARPEGGRDARTRLHPLFKTADMPKDVRLCLEEAKPPGCRSPRCPRRDLLAATVGRGYGMRTYAAMIEASRASPDGVVDRCRAGCCGGRRRCRALGGVVSVSRPTTNWNCGSD